MTYRTPSAELATYLAKTHKYRLWATDNSGPVTTYVLEVPEGHSHKLKKNIDDFYARGK